ncbi:MAG: molybdate ABC transporter permease subunit [Thermodesulfobacteriota bacterium]
MDWAAVLTPLGLTLKVAGVATVATFVVGVALAFWVARSRFWGREGLDSLCTLPLVMPPTVLGYFLIVLIGSNGCLGQWLKSTFGISLIFTWQGAALAASVVSLPLIYKSARAAFEGVDPNLENAARTLGASEAGVFFRVSLPLAWRGILAGAMMAFARAMGEFGATLMVAGNLPGKTQTLSVAVYDAMQAGNDSAATILVIIVSAVCLTIMLVSGKALKIRYL